MNLEDRMKTEEGAFQKTLELFNNIQVSYGSEILLYHCDSNMFLNGKILSPGIEKSAFKFELSNEYGPGMIFQILPRYRVRQVGTTVQYSDSIILLNQKLSCYLNFTAENPVEIKGNSEKKGEILVGRPPARCVDPISKRFETYLTHNSDITWKFSLYGKYVKPNSTEDTYLKGGDIIRLGLN